MRKGATELISYCIKQKNTERTDSKNLIILQTDLSIETVVYLKNR